MEARIAQSLLISAPLGEVGPLSVAAPQTFNWPQAMQAAFQKPPGARFYRCALQVNTPLQTSFKGFDSRHTKHSTAYKRDYGLALAKKCKKAGIDVVGICDHNSVDYLDSIRQQLNEENIFVFPGFEVASTEGLHALCLFDLDTPARILDHILTELGLPPRERWVTGVGGAPRQSPQSFPQILEHVQHRRRGICIAAHIDRENGLLFECSKTTRAQYFTNPQLLAGQISSARKKLTPFNRKIIGGELTHYRRPRPLALVNCLDVYNLKDLGVPACSSWIKMSKPSLEGLWQAFLDPQSRLRLLTEAEAPRLQRERERESFKLLAMSWEGGFLDGCGIRFNENFNCLIGGRGTGKSTVIESLRYVLEQPALGQAAQESQQSLLQQVVQTGTRISLLLHTQLPAPGYYRIERVYDEQPEVFDEHGERCPLKVADLFAHVDIFGQHEIAEIARQPEKQLALLQRFRQDHAARWQVEKHETHVRLAHNRDALLEILGKLQVLEEQLHRLPSLEKELARFRELGVEQKLMEQSLLARENQILRSGQERFMLVKKALEQFRQLLENHETERGAPQHGQLPNRDLCDQLHALEEHLHATLQEALTTGEEAWQRASLALLELRQAWETRKRSRQEAYQKILRDLQKETIPGVEYVNLRKEFEQLQPLRAQLQQLHHKRRELEKQRKRLLQQGDQAAAQLFKIDQAAAAHASRLLAGQVQVEVIAEGTRTPLLEKFKALKLKRPAELFERLRVHEGFHLRDFVAHLRTGSAALGESYDLTNKQAQALQNLGAGAVLELEELELPHGVHIRLNVAAPHEKPKWRALSEISVGQRATAILLLLLPESGAPLIIDQPEDDLDNRFIADQIIPKLREEKQKRQFLFATHNANLPVLGDAEQIIGLEASGDGAVGRAQIDENSLGSIDCKPVKELVEQILEGGKQAFEMRRAKYGF